MDGLTTPLVSEEIVPCDQAKIIRGVSSFVAEQILGPPFLLKVSNGLEEAVLTEMQLIPLAVMSGAITPVSVEAGILKSAILRTRGTAACITQDVNDGLDLDSSRDLHCCPLPMS
jgi:hypothetical protein